MNNNRISIAVLLTCHNRKYNTLLCLDSLFESIDVVKGYEYDVYLVDDASTDGTSEAVKEKYPSVNILKGTGNLFWNRGMHYAWTTAADIKSYKYYLWLNDDTFLFKSSLKMIFEISEGLLDNCIVVGTTIADKESSKVTYGGFNNSSKLIIPNGTIQICHHFNGNIVLVPDKIHRIVGKNDPVFHHALGDFDYGLRAKKLGVESVIAPQVLGICSEHPEIASWFNAQTPLFTRINLLYSPLGNNPFEFFVFKRRHWGILSGIKYLIANHIRAVFPSLWLKH